MRELAIPSKREFYRILIGLHIWIRLILEGHHVYCFARAKVTVHVWRRWKQNTLSVVITFAPLNFQVWCCSPMMSSGKFSPGFVGLVVIKSTHAHTRGTVGKGVGGRIIRTVEKFQRLKRGIPSWKFRDYLLWFFTQWHITEDWVSFRDGSFSKTQPWYFLWGLFWESRNLRDIISFNLIADIETNSTQMIIWSQPDV